MNFDVNVSNKASILRLRTNYFLRLLLSILIVSKSKSKYVFIQTFYTINRY